MKRKDFDYVIEQFESKMGFCPETFKAFAWEQAKNQNYTVNEFFDGLYETLRLINKESAAYTLNSYSVMTDKKLN
mgnify:CR=1 FL=1|jgi:hypothetical protein|tara:strand:- start:260 stop:484 length:225 start_codon:yes stop_codon:yes gene_type:complete